MKPPKPKPPPVMPVPKPLIPAGAAPRPEKPPKPLFWGAPNRPPATADRAVTQVAPYKVPQQKVRFNRAELKITTAQRTVSEKK